MNLKTIKTDCYCDFLKLVSLTVPNKVLFCCMQALGEAQSFSIKSLVMLNSLANKDVLLEILTH